MKKTVIALLGTVLCLSTAVTASADTVVYDLGSGGYLQETLLWNGDVLSAKGEDSVNVTTGSNSYQGCSSCGRPHKSHSISEGIFLKGDTGHFATDTKEISMIVEENGAFVTKSETVECKGTVIKGPVLVYGEGNAKFTQTDVKCNHGSIVDTYYYSTGHPVVVMGLDAEAIPVRYDYNGGTLPSADTNPTKLSFAKDFYKEELVMPVKIGYSCSFKANNSTFAWFDASDSAIMVSPLNAMTFRSAKSTLEEGGLVFTAKWEAVDLNITFVNEGCENAADLDSQNTLPPKASRELGAPEIEGYELEGFYAGDTKITNLDQIPVKMWNAKQEYTVTVKWKKRAGDSTEAEGNGNADTNAGGAGGNHTDAAGSDNTPTTPETPSVIAPSTTAGLETGKTAAVKGITYTALAKDEVAVKQIEKKAKTVTIPDTVTIGGKKYKVTTIGNNACKGCKSLKTAVIGKNIKSIGNNAFNGCTKLTKLTIRSAKIKTIGKNAFKKCGAKSGAKLTVDVPDSKIKSYKKLFVKKGLSKKAKIK